MVISPSPAAHTSKLLEADVLSLELSDLADSTHLASSQEEKGLEMLMETSQPACPAYDEILEVMAHATERLDLPCRLGRLQIAHERLDMRFLTGHKCAGHIHPLHCMNYMNV